MKLVSSVLEGMESIHIIYVIGLLLFIVLFFIKTIPYYLSQ